MVPISVTIHRNIVYVLNNGTATSAGNIAGFRLSTNGELSFIHGSVNVLSGHAITPGEISFNPFGTVLAVTEKNSNLIDTYTVDDDGIPHGPILNTSHGMTPFGFAFDTRGVLVVSEAAGGPAGTGLSSYTVESSGQLNTISGSVPDNGLAACWVVTTSDSRLAFTTNAHSGTISSYEISHNGHLTLDKSIAATTGAGDTDMALSSNNQFLYVNVGGVRTVKVYNLNGNGSLEWIQSITVPAGIDGLAAN
jgi:6-phosphogluconolactonase (cycloisomerase 2 family)